MEVAESSDTTTHFWDQDLDDVLHILGLESPHSPSFREDNAVTIPDEQLSPVSKYNLGADFNFFQNPLPLQTPRLLQNEVHHQQVAEMTTFSPKIKIQTRSSQCSASLQNHQLDICNADSSVVPDTTDVISNSIQPINSPSAHTTSYNTDCAVMGPQSSRSTHNQAQLETKFRNGQKTGNSSPLKRKLASPIQGPSKLFRILSHILQAFESPMTTELEERYAFALQKALVEIQNARTHFQQSPEQEVK